MADKLIPMLAVIATFECDPAAAAWLAAIRTAHDPLQDRVGPHVTLMFPAALEDGAALRGRLENGAAATPAFDLGFDRLDRMEDPLNPKYRFLNVLLADAASAARLDALRRRITDSNAAYRPHMTISRFGAAYCAKALERQLGIFDVPLRGRIGALELLRIEHGMVRLEARYPLPS